MIFALIVCVSCILLMPASAALISMLMLGNFLRECGVTERLVKASQNEIINVVTIFLGTSVGFTMNAERFDPPDLEDHRPGCLRLRPVHRRRGPDGQAHEPALPKTRSIP